MRLLVDSHVLATTSSWWLLVSTLTASTYAQSPTVSVTQAGTTFIASWSQPTDSPRFFLGQVLLFNITNQANANAGMGGLPVSIITGPSTPSSSCSVPPCIATTTLTELPPITTIAFSIEKSFPTGSYSVEVDYFLSSTIVSTATPLKADSPPFTVAATAEGSAAGATATASHATASGNNGASTSNPAPGANQTALSVPGSTLSASSEPAASSSGLSTGATAGIAVGVVAVVLAVLVAFLIFCLRRRRRLRKAGDPVSPTYSNDPSSTNRDLMAEKEANVLSSPVTWGSDHNAAAAPVPQSPLSQRRVHLQDAAAPAAMSEVPPATGSYSDEGHPAAGSYVEHQRLSTHSPASFAGSSSHSPPSRVASSAAHAAPGAALAAPVARKPVGGSSTGSTPPLPTSSTAVPATVLHEPGMTEEEVARLEDEERRLDEAIAEAERRRAEGRRGS